MLWSRLFNFYLGWLWPYCSGDWSFGKFFDQNIHWFGTIHEYKLLSFVPLILDNFSKNSSVIWLLLCCHTWNWSGQGRTAHQFEGFLKFDNYFSFAASWKNSWNFELDFSSSAVGLRRFLFTSKYVEKSY